MNTASTASPKPDHSAFNERRRRFIGNLRSLEGRDDGPSRAGLAALRAGLRAKNGIAIEMMPHVVPYLDERERPGDCWFFAVAALFAAHPLTTTQNISLGGSFGRLRRKSGSIEKRFQLLLDSDEEDLFDRLKQIVSLLKAHNVPVNWYALLRDLTARSWNDPQRHLQLEWARDFYRSAPINSASDAT